MDLQDYRSQIDAIDDELVSLFTRRMDVVRDIVEYKKANHMKILDAGRERDKLAKLCQQVPEELQTYLSVWYSTMFELSRSYQSRQMTQFTNLSQTITDAIEHTPRLFPESACVAVAGVEGAYAQIAAEKLIQRPFVMYFNGFEGVFSAVESGLCRYGVVPIENSTAGSVQQVYDLMVSHKFSIVRSVRLKIDHNLLVNPGTRLEDIKEIYSHQQAISQCRSFLQSLGPDVKIIPLENTAKAAQEVARSGRTDVAALASRSCMELYGLECLRRSVQDQGNNYTRFVCISKELEIYPGASRTSILLTTAHKPGALYKLLSRFYALGINVTKLESRPIPERDFEFRFYFDLETSVYSQAYIQMICELSASSEEFVYLGSYSEVI